MKQENKTLLIKYIVSFCIASLITVLVFWIKGFFVHSTAVNVQILADGFTVSGLMMSLFAGMVFVSDEGALLGIGYVLRNVVLAFIPMGRMRHEKYADYRERKLGERKKSSDRSALVIGLVFLAIGIIFNGIWYTVFYTPPAA